MKEKRILVVLPVAAGLLAAGLRTLLYGVALDKKGLLAAGHPLTYALWAVAFCGAGAMVVSAWRQKDIPGSEAEKSVPAAVGDWLLAVGIVLPGDTAVSQLPALNTIYLAVRCAAVAALIVAGVCRLRGKQPSFGFYAVTSVFFAVHMVMRYQTWSSHPQMQDYVFALLGCIFLALLAYYRTAAAVDMDKPRLRLAFGMLACCCCCAAIPYGEFRLLYLTGGVWALTALWNSGTKTEENAEERE